MHVILCYYSNVAIKANVVPSVMKIINLIIPFDNDRLFYSDQIYCQVDKTI